LGPGQRVSGGAQILGADVGHAVGGADNLDLAPEFGAGRAGILLRGTNEKEARYGDRNRRNKGAEKVACYISHTNLLPTQV
jgi:hypothetical protein